jgi:RNAse (barnase) inhibitor barstar
MASVQLNGEAITDWDSFHSACAAAFGFPEFYGRTMDAWVDCLSYLRDDENMTRFHLKPNEILQITISHADALQKNAPDLLEEVAFCIAGINERYDDYGEKPALELKLA